MKKQPLVSVYIPTFRRPDFLAQAIQSVLGNGYDPIEVVVSDDDPEGSAQAVALRFSDPRIRYITKPAPPGKTKNWQHAVLHTKGKYCFKLDDDDLIEFGFISACAEFLESHPQAVCVYTGYTSWERNGEKLVETNDSFFGSEQIVSGPAYIRAVLANEGGYPRVQKTAVFYQRHAGEKIQFYENACEDFAFGAALALHGDVGYIPQPLYIWRQHATNNVLNLHYTWTVSLQALDGLKKMSPPANTLPLSDWLSLVRRCEQALPLFYLQASFQANGRKATWEFWRKLRNTERYKPSIVHFLYLFIGTLLPSKWHRKIFFLYRKSGFLQKLARRFLTSGET
jgi:glycosyltransferase involved in cell wall biosynthesis